MSKPKKINGHNAIAEAVENSLNEYFFHLDGEPADDIYRMVIDNVEKTLFKNVMERAEAGLPHVPPDDYVEQIQGQLWVSERAWCDFVSYDDRFPEPLRLLTFRVYRDDAMINALAIEVPKFAALATARIGRVKELIRNIDPEWVDRVLNNVLETSHKE